MVRPSRPLMGPDPSRKYGSSDARMLLAAGGWTTVAEWTDPDELFAVLLAEAQARAWAP